MVTPDAENAGREQRRRRLVRGLRHRLTEHGDGCLVTVAGEGEAKVEQDVRAFPGGRRLGKRFAQLGGTWLGLSVSKRLIEAQGGSLGIDARPGTGNAFWFHLPLLTNIK